MVTFYITLITRMYIDVYLSQCNIFSMKKYCIYNSSGYSLGVFIRHDLEMIFKKINNVIFLIINLN
jgi:hypothetical protein